MSELNPTVSDAMVPVVQAAELQIKTLNNNRAKKTIVLIHGWGSGEDCWGELLGALQQEFSVISVALPGYDSNKNVALNYELFFDALIKKIPKNTLLMGWSLGGLLAIELANRYPNYFAGVITLATNPCFIRNNEWPGMAQDTFSNFVGLVEKHPSNALLYFASLEAYGDAQEKKLLKELKSSVKQNSLATKKVLIEGLVWLKNIDARKSLAGLTIPSLHFFATGDALVPISVAEKIKPLNENADVFIVPNSGHRFFYFNSESLLKKINSWFERKPSEGSGKNNTPELDKLAMIRAFDKAANTYDRAAHLQRKIADNLLKDVQKNSQDNRSTIADIGCGTGYLTGKLKNNYSNALVFGVDVSPAMVAYAENKFKGEDDKLIFLQGGAEDLPLNDKSIDVITANFSLQWCDDLSIALYETRRVLKKQGKAFFTLPIEGTLTELSQAWAQVDDYKHVNTFISQETLVNKLQGVFLDKFTLSIQQYTEYYENYFSLAKELKALGVTNVNNQRRNGLTGSASLKKLISAYDAFKNKDNLLPVTWVVATIEITGQ